MPRLRLQDMRSPSGGDLTTVISTGGKRGNEYTPATERFLSQHGHTPIVSLIVFRTPIETYLHKALNLITFGGWDAVKRKYKYDTLFHLGMVATLDAGAAGKQVLVEKNENVVMKFGFTQKPETEVMQVPLGTEILTLQKMANNARKGIGEYNFFHYNAFKSEANIQRPEGTNCQGFITAMLQYSGVLTASLRKFIQQDVEQVLKDLPSYTQALVERAAETAIAAKETINIALE